MPSWKTIFNWTGIVFLLFLGIPIRVKHPQRVKDEFALYMTRFNKTYIPDSEEYTKRLDAFTISLAKIEELNAGKFNNNLSASYGLTKFSDLTESEFLALHLDRVKILSKSHQKKVKTQLFNGGILSASNPIFYGFNSVHRVRRELINNGIPLKFDWRDKGVISNVPDQGLCGACWAYSTIQTAEAMASARQGSLINLSVQQVIDCATNGNYGCKGGDICSLLVWLTRNNITIDEAKDYPISGITDECHHVKESPKGVRIKDFTCGSFIGREKDIVTWIAKIGPVAVAINAITWQNYLGGIIQHHCPGDLTSLNHAVQIIGYDLSADIPYFIAKNSWGKSFGLEGYLHLAIGTNICGLANEVSMLHIY